MATIKEITKDMTFDDLKKMLKDPSIPKKMREELERKNVILENNKPVLK